jgi:hypothetical protein
MEMATEMVGKGEGDGPGVCGGGLICVVPSVVFSVHSLLSLSAFVREALYARVLKWILFDILRACSQSDNTMTSLHLIGLTPLSSKAG